MQAYSVGFSSNPEESFCIHQDVPTCFYAVQVKILDKMRDLLQFVKNLPELNPNISL
jgi:hypothetical protein